MSDTDGVMFRLVLLVFVASITMSSCYSTIDKLKRVGRAPEFTKIRVPATGAQKSPEEDVAEIERQKARAGHIKATNSLWQKGQTSFFQDTRTWKVGDIITVIVDISNKAQLNNSTSSSRSSDMHIGVPNLMGKEGVLASLFNKDNAAAAANLVNANSSNDHSGSGQISRKENISIKIAATVITVLPNKSLFVQGSQEILVNSEMRAVGVAGIVSPTDITARGTVGLDQIAEARVLYGGHGTISDVQEKPVGNQILTILSPF